MLTLPLLVIRLCRLLQPLFNLEIVDLRSVCSLTGTIQHIKMELIRAGCQTHNRQLRIGVFLTRRISADRNLCPGCIAYLAVPRTVRAQTGAKGIIIAERPQHFTFSSRTKALMMRSAIPATDRPDTGQ